MAGKSRKGEMTLAVRLEEWRQLAAACEGLDVPLVAALRGQLQEVIAALASACDRQGEGSARLRELRRLREEAERRGREARTRLLASLYAVLGPAGLRELGWTFQPPGTGAAQRGRRDG